MTTPKLSFTDAKKNSNPSIPEKDIVQESPINKTTTPTKKLPAENTTIKKINKKVIKHMVYILLGGSAAIALIYFIFIPEKQQTTEEAHNKKILPSVQTTYDPNDFIRMKNIPQEKVYVYQQNKSQNKSSEKKPSKIIFPQAIPVEENYDADLSSDDKNAIYPEKQETTNDTQNASYITRKEYDQQNQETKKEPTIFTGIGKTVSTRVSPVKNNMSNDAYLQSMLGKKDSEWDIQNGQRNKQKFLSNAQSKNVSTYLESIKIQPISDYMLLAGTIIPITLITGINSDLPGQIVGQVISDVYDTVRGNYVLIPAGSRVIGEYDNAITYDQERVLVAWQRLIYPDGQSINLWGMLGVDLEGYAGYNDKVDLHIDKIIGLLGISTLLSVGTNVANVAASGNAYANAVIKGLQKGSDDTASVIGKWANKLLNRQPTIQIRSGKRVNILVHKDMILEPYYKKER